MYTLIQLHTDNWCSLLSEALKIDPVSGSHPYVSVVNAFDENYISVQSPATYSKATRKMPLLLIKEITQKILYTEPSETKRNELKNIFQKFVDAKVAKLERSSISLLNHVQTICHLNLYTKMAFKLLFPKFPDSVLLAKQQIKELSNFCPPFNFIAPKEPKFQILAMLPNELWVLILSFFESNYSRREMNALLQVSKDMYFHCQEINKSRMYQQNLPIKFTFGCETSGEARSCAIVHQFRDINFGRIRMLQHDLEYLAEKCTRIQKMRMVIENRVNLPSGFDQLTYLKVMGTSAANDKLSFGQLVRIPMLKRLSIECLKVKVDFMVSGFFNLTSLTLKNIWGLSLLSFASIGSLKQLTKLVLKSIRVAQNEEDVNTEYDNIISQLSKLKTLKISDNMLRDAGITSIPTLQSLERIELSVADYTISDKGIKKIAKTPTLKFFALHGKTISEKVKMEFIKRGIVEVKAKKKPFNSEPFSKTSRSILSYKLKMPFNE